MNISPQKIKNIIFDLGGVILNIAPQLAFDAFEKLIPETEIETAFEYLNKQEIFDRLETGKITPIEFRNEIRQYLKPNTTDNQIDAAWNKMLLDFPPQRIELLKHLNENYRTFLLSNTNEIHRINYFEQLNSLFQIETLSPLFEDEYYSHELGLKKPDAKIFELLLNDKSLNPQETLFIDDTESNIITAQKLGIQTIHIKPKQEITEIFKTLSF